MSASTVGLTVGPDAPPALGPPPAALAPRVPGVARLAVLRSGGLGDYVVAEPAVAALRAAYPDAEVTMLGAGHAEPLVRGRPSPVDRFVAVPRLPGVRWGDAPDDPPDVVERWCAAQRSYGYDLVVNLHGGGANSNPLVRRLGARVCAGAAAPDAPRLDRWVPYTLFQHDTVRWLEVAAACGAPPVRVEPALAVTACDLAAAAAALDGVLPPADGRPLLAVHPGATDPRRRWRPPRLGQVAAAVAADAGATRATVVVLGAPGEADLVDAVVAACPGAVALTTPSLSALLGVLTRARLFLGNDSGPRHLAAAVGTPTVGVFTYANLADVAPLVRTWHRVAVDWASACSVCGLRMLDGECGHGATALDGVTVDEVVALARDLWRQTDAAVVAPPALGTPTA